MDCQTIHGMFHQEYRGRCHMFWLVVILYTYGMFAPCVAQFPAVCSQNATKPNATCCPIPPGESGPCGFPYRGYCFELEDVHEVFSPPLPDQMNDDRLNWPKRFFQHTCTCVGNFAGYMCQECKYGFYGRDCLERRIQKRKNFLTLPEHEQRRFVDLLHQAKFTQSEYVAINLGPQDPVVNVTFTPVSIYDLFIFVHYYSARNTYINATTPCVPGGKNHFDTSHKGSAFPFFHRAFTLLWEREFQKLAKDDTFMFPYWDWIDNGDECPVCTNEWLGAVNKSHPLGYLDKRSKFSEWYTLCTPSSNPGPMADQSCRFCDVRRRVGGIIRRPGKDYPRLPISEEVDETLTFTKYDAEPFDSSAPDNVFRNCFEGNCGKKGVKYGIHNLVHAFFSGTLSGVTTSTNDPLFILHHSFLDKLLERWIRIHRPHKTHMPEYQAPLGHNRDSVLVGFFPRHFVHQYLADSRSLGFDYDDYNYGGKEKPHPDTYFGFHPSTEAYKWEAVFVITGMAFSVFVALLIYDRHFSPNNRYSQCNDHIRVPTEDPELHENIINSDSDVEDMQKEPIKNFKPPIMKKSVI